jgi:hypothetical protein
MTMHRSITTMVCSEYQQLLEQSKHARDIWDLRPCGNLPLAIGRQGDGDELLRLQANYALAYTRLRRHVDNCLRCQHVSKIA